MNQQVLGVNVLQGPDGSGKSTALKHILKSRPFIFYFAMREICETGLRLECFLKDFLSDLGYKKPWGSTYLQAIPSVKTLDNLNLDELRWLYVVGLRAMRTVLASDEVQKEAKRLGIRPLVIIDDADELKDLAEEGTKEERSYGKGLVQELLNMGIMIAQEDASANVIISTNDDYAVRYFQRNFDGLQDGRLSEAEIYLDDISEESAKKYLRARAEDLKFELSDELFNKIYQKIGGRFSDLSRVPLPDPSYWISSQEEELRQMIHHLLETTQTQTCTHAKIMKLLQAIQRCKSGICALSPLRQILNDNADLCIQEMSALNVITKMSVPYVEERSAMNSDVVTRVPSAEGNVTGSFVTARSPFLLSVLNHMSIVLPLKIKLSTEDKSEARFVELKNLDILELKRVIAHSLDNHSDCITKIKSQNGRIQKSKELLMLNSGELIEVEFSKQVDCYSERHGL